MTLRPHRARLVFATAVSLALTLPSVASAAGPEQWVARYDGTGNVQEHDDEVAAIAASPDGSKVFVTGTSASAWTGSTDYATVAYDATTGAQLWAKRYTAALNGGSDYASSVAVAPDGSSVFVTGSSDGGGFSFDYFTIAYDASTGTKLWAKRFGTSHDDVAYAVVASADGSKVFVTGDSRVGPFAADADYATVAYDASTGTKLWVKRYDGPHHNYDVAVAASVSPDGSAVFVTGKSKGSPDFDYATVAYRAATGRRMWVARYDGPRSDADEAYAIASSPDGARVVVAGMSVGSTTGRDFATVTYDATTGQQQWVGRYTGPKQATDKAKSVAFSDDSSAVFVTGEKAGGSTHLNYATVAYDADAGTQLWADVYDDAVNSIDAATAVVTAGSLVVVTGYATTASFTFGYTTIAYDAATGTRQWIYPYDGPSYGGFARDIAASPDGAQVFVTGTNAGVGTGDDYATVAYAT